MFEARRKPASIASFCDGRFGHQSSEKKSMPCEAVAMYVSATAALRELYSPSSGDCGGRSAARSYPCRKFDGYHAW